jgi:hypothetical protein
MASLAQAFDAAEEAALRGSAGLATAMGGLVRLYTEVPEGAPLPYVVRGNVAIQIERSDCADEGEITSTIEWWSKVAIPDKGAQARAMGGAIVDALDAQLILTGHRIVEWSLEIEQYSTDPDQSTHGRAVFNYQTTQIVA